MNEIRDVEGLYNRYRQVPLYLIGMFCLMTVFMYFVGIVAGVIATIFTAIYGIINIVVFLRMNSLSRDRYVEFAMEHGKMQKELIKEFPVPYALLDEDGKLVWVNDEFSSITDTSKRKLMKLNIVQVFEEVTEESLPYEENVTEGEISFCGRKYRYEIRRVQVNKFEPVIDDVDGQNPVGEPVDDKPAADDGDGVKRRGSSHHKTDTFLAFYMFDVTVVNRLTQENHDQKLVAGLIYIDNYDEIFESLEEVRHSLLVALVDRKINKYMANVDAIVKSLEKDKYMFVMPQKYLDQLKENKFALLDEVKAINIGNDLPLTLSISLGTDYKSFIENFEAARSAMELALGRGGDQAAGAFS